MIEIEDDGRGIPWDELRSRVQARRGSAATRQELVAALFADGISTAREVTETSGRGLGMGALHLAVQALGGDLEIDSEPGRGTCVRLRFPRHRCDRAGRGTDAQSLARHSARRVRGRGVARRWRRRR